MIAKKTMIVRSIASMSSLSNATDSCSEHDQHEPNGRKVHRPKLVCCTPGSPKRAYPWGVGLVSNHQDVVPPGRCDFQRNPAQPLGRDLLRGHRQVERG